MENKYNQIPILIKTNQILQIMIQNLWTHLKLEKLNNNIILLQMQNLIKIKI